MKGTLSWKAKIHVLGALTTIFRVEIPGRTRTTVSQKSRKPEAESYTTSYSVLRRLAA